MTLSFEKYRFEIVKVKKNVLVPRVQSEAMPLPSRFELQIIPFIQCGVVQTNKFQEQADG